MPLERTKALYRRTLRDEVAIRRYFGTGPTRTSTDWTCRARVTGNGQSDLVVGTVRQFEYSAVVLVEDLTDDGTFVLPITAADKLVVNGRELAIAFPDNATRADEETLVAFQIQAKG